MDFDFSSRRLQGPGQTLQRLLEILPGAASWTILLGLTALSWCEPAAAAVLIIAFELYWLFRLFYGTLFLVLSYALLCSEKGTDWMQEIRRLERREVELIPNPRRQREILNLLKSGAAIPSAGDIRHLVIIPVAKETAEVIEPGILSLRRQTFPTTQMLVVLAVEERAGVPVKAAAERLAREHRRHFLDFWVVVHPDGLPGEERVKGANATYAARRAAAYLQEKNIAFENTVLSCFDADTVVDPQYFACLTYHFIACPCRARASFQPVPVYHNNLWDVPGFARVLETGSSFFLLIESTDAEKLVTFSSHSMSFRALVDAGYWPVDMISDDSAIFWKAFIRFDGDYRVVPMYITVSMDVAASDTWWKTARNIYKQKRRWAWGVENFPLVVRAFLGQSRISWYNRFRYAFKLFEGHVAWATWAFLLTFVGWMPAFFAGKEFSNSVLYYSSPRIAAAIFHLSFLSFLVSVVISLFLLPKQKTKQPFLRRVGFAFEWFLIPLIATFLSALPALDTQTRFMLGRRLHFWVTDKCRKQKIGQ